MFCRCSLGWLKKLCSVTDRHETSGDILWCLAPGLGSGSFVPCVHCKVAHAWLRCRLWTLNLIVIWEAWRSGQYLFALLCVHPTVSKHYFCHMARGFACYGRLLLSRNIIQWGWRWGACHEEIFRWVLNVQITSTYMQILKVSQQNWLMTRW